MSIRSLFEFNHDYAHEIADDPEGFVEALRRYLACADSETAAALERYGARQVSVRHHSHEFFIRQNTEGFPARIIYGHGARVDSRDLPRRSGPDNLW